MLRFSLACVAIVIGIFVYRDHQAREEDNLMVAKAQELLVSNLYLEPARYEPNAEPLRQNQLPTEIQKMLGYQKADSYLESHYQKYCSENVSECLPRFAMRADGKWYFRGYCRIFSGTYTYKNRSVVHNWRQQDFPAVAYGGLELKLQQTQLFNCDPKEAYLTRTEYEYLVGLIHAKYLLVAYPVSSQTRKTQPKLIFETEGQSRMGWTLPENNSQLPLRLPAATKMRLSAAK